VTELFTGVPADSRSVQRGLVARRAVVTLLALFSLLALADLFGQQPTESAAGAPGARMTLSAPKTVRGGLFFQSRVEIRALQGIGFPRLVLDRGWVEGMQVNSIEPAPDSETSRDGRLVLTFAKLAPGDVLRVWLQFEVDPTNVGHRSYGLELDDATQPLTRISRSLTVLP
jgi:hypothetical protein